MFSFRTTSLEDQMDRALHQGSVSCFCTQNCWDTDRGRYMYDIFHERGNLSIIFSPRDTELTPLSDDEALTAYLWPIVREMVKTAIENDQNLIVEGCYIPFDWRQDFDERYLPSIRFVCLAMTEEYIKSHFDAIKTHESVIESRLIKNDFSIDGLIAENQRMIAGFQDAGEQVVLIESDYEQSITEILTSVEN